MRIVCDSCGAKYSIADEKIAGKLFKVRCKKCDNMIMVDGTALGGDETVLSPAASTEAGWYVVIDGAQTGPLSVDEVVAQVNVGAVDSTSFAWREGMGDWLPLSEIPEFDGLLPAAGDPFEDEATRVASMDEVHAPAPVAEAPVPVPAPEPVVEAPKPSGAGLLSHSGNTAAGPSDFFGAGAAAQSSQSPEPRPSSGSALGTGLTDERSENSVLFSLNDLTSSKSKAADDQIPRTDGSGLIDIRVLANTQSAASAGAGDSVGVPITPMALPPRKSNKGLVAAIGFGSVIMLGLIGVLVFIAFFKDDPTFQPPTTEPPAVAVNDAAGAETGTLGEGTVVEPAVPTLEGSGVADVAAVPPVEPPLEGSGATAVAAGSGEAALTELAALTPPSADGTATSPEAEEGTSEREERDEPEVEREERDEPEVRSERAEREERDEPREEAVAAREEVEAPPSREDDNSERSADAVGNALDAIRSQREPEEEEEEEEEEAEETLSRDAVRSTIRRYRSQVARCDDGSGGRYSVRFTIQPSGNVSNARAQDSDDVSRCIVGVVRDMEFPEFSGNAVPVTYPFNF
ncbi:MAG: putative Zn finger-like uncharacterized protein [Bradymonadia bacterium]|jgi:predicted Zn finger-like uncharacterized protein